MSVKKKPARESAVIEEVVLDDTETEKDIAAVEEALKISEDLVSLEGFYYGIRNPDVDLVTNEFKISNIGAKAGI